MTYNVDNEAVENVDFVYLEWQTTPPTEPGAYWVIHDGRIMVANVVYQDVLCVAEAYEYYTPVTSKFYTHWLGPLPAPEMPK